MRVAAAGPARARARRAARRLRGARESTPWAPAPAPLWREALGANVLDVDGNRYVDLTSGFGVALVGHRHPRVVAAVRRQAGAAAARPRRRPRAPGARRARRRAGGARADARRRRLLRGLGLRRRRGGAQDRAARDRPARRARLHGRLPRLDARRPRRRRPRELPRAVRRPSARARRAPALRRRGERDRARASPTDASAASSSSRSRGAPASCCRRRGGSPSSPRWRGVTARCWSPTRSSPAADAPGRSSPAPPRAWCPTSSAAARRSAAGCRSPPCSAAASCSPPGRRSGEALHTATFLAHPLACAAALATLRVLGHPDFLARATALAAAIATGVEELAALPAVRGGARPRPAVGHRAARDAAAGGGAAWARRALGAGVLALPAGAEGEVLEMLPPAVLTLRQLAVALAGLRRTAPVATAPGRSSAGAIRYVARPCTSLLARWLVVAVSEQQLAALPILDHFPAEQRARLAQATSLVRFPGGVTVIKEGDASLDAYIVHRGRVLIKRDTSYGIVRDRPSRRGRALRRDQLRRPLAALGGRGDRARQRAVRARPEDPRRPRRRGPALRHGAVVDLLAQPVAEAAQHQRTAHQVLQRGGQAAAVDRRAAARAHRLVPAAAGAEAGPLLRAEALAHGDPLPRLAVARAPAATPARCSSARATPATPCTWWSRGACASASTSPAPARKRSPSWSAATGSARWR